MLRPREAQHSVTRCCGLCCHLRGSTSCRAHHFDGARGVERQGIARLGFRLTDVRDIGGIASRRRSGASTNQSGNLIDRQAQVLADRLAVRECPRGYDFYAAEPLAARRKELTYVFKCK